MLATVPALLSAAISNHPEIKLTAAKDIVLPIKQRTTVLETAETYLNRSDEVFSAGIDAVNNPYSTGVVADSAEKAVTTNVIVYDNTSILELIQANLEPQIRGTIAKGDVYYLQLNGGGMLGEGDSFPAQVPQVEGEFFMVMIQEITHDGYVLKMNDIAREVTFEKTSGIIKDSAK